MWINNNQRLLSLALPENFIREEFLQSLANFPLLESCNIFHGCRSGSEPMQRLQLQTRKMLPDQNLPWNHGTIM
jgi:hypothetical protein